LIEESTYTLDFALKHDMTGNFDSIIEIYTTFFRLKVGYKVNCWPYFRNFLIFYNPSIFFTLKLYEVMKLELFSLFRQGTRVVEYNDEYRREMAQVHYDIEILFQTTQVELDQ
jgi:hypothetical protein